MPTWPRGGCDPSCSPRCPELEMGSRWPRPATLPVGESWLPAPSERAGGQEKREAGPDRKVKDFGITAPGSGGVHDGLLKTIYEIGGRKEQSNALDRTRQK